MKKQLLLFSLIIITNKVSAIKNAVSGTTYSRIKNKQDRNVNDNKAHISTYGVQKSEPRTDVISTYFQYNIPTDQLNIHTTSESLGAFASQANAQMTLSSGNTDTNFTCSVVSKSAINYHPGHEIQGYFTAGFLVTTSTYESGAFKSTQYAGMLTADDGFAVGYQGNTFGVYHRRNGSQKSWTAQTSFNIDKLDGTGPSGMIIDPSKLNIYSITYGWLGTAAIKFHVVREDGQLVPFHIIQGPNSDTSPTVYNPSLPIALEIFTHQNDTLDGYEIFTASWNGTSLGEYHGTRNWSYNVVNKTLSGSTDQLLMVLRNKYTFNNKTSTSKVRLTYINVSGVEAGNIAHIKLIKNPLSYVGSNPSYSDIDTNLSVVKVATMDPSADSVTGGTTIFNMNAYARTTSTLFFKPNDYIIDLFPTDELAVVAAENGTGDYTISIALGWEEFY